jgi:hypothetical protein
VVWCGVTVLLGSISDCMFMMFSQTDWGSPALDQCLLYAYLCTLMYIDRNFSLLGS